MPFKEGEQAPGSVPFKIGEDERRNLNGSGKHRSTIARKWLEIEVNETNPLTGLAEKLSYEDIITLAQIKKAKDEQDTNAYKALQDSAYGAPKQEVTGLDGAPLFPTPLQFTDGTGKG